jgi:alpha-tubulin suppressor-like RCC1 family protein
MRRNYSGQLGDGTTHDRLELIEVKELTSSIAAIAAGHVHTCALTTTGGVKCWGDNKFGQLGDGTTDHRQEPTGVKGLGSDVRRH